MKLKTINKELRKLHNKWLKSIKDENVAKLIKRDTIITGGSIASMLLQEDVNDYDVYFATAECVAAVAEYYVDKLKEIDKAAEAVRFTYEDDYLKGITKRQFVKSKAGRLKVFIPGSGYWKLDGTKRKEFEPIYLTANSIMLKGKIQLVLRFWGDPKEIHSNYDFTHTKAYWTPKELVVPEETALALLTKELKYQGSKYPLTSIIRTRKFIRRGWTITAGEYLKMCVQLQNFDLLNPAVLEDQLMGVDIAYFMAFINKMKVYLKNPKNKVTTDYLIDLVDEVFNEDHDEINERDE